MIIKQGYIFMLGVLCLASSGFAQQDSFFPLEIGNVWIMRTVDDSLKRTHFVSDTSTINGKLYYRVVTNSNYERLYREDATGIFYERRYPLELPIMDFKMMPGDSIFFTNGFTICLERKNVELDNEIVEQIKFVIDWRADLESDTAMDKDTLILQEGRGPLQISCAEVQPNYSGPPLATQKRVASTIGGVSYGDNDAYLTHYQTRTGNMWDYAGYNVENHFYRFPNLIFKTAIGESLHTDGYLYNIIKEDLYALDLPYHVSGSNAFGRHLTTIKLQRLDSLSTEVYVIGEDFTFDYQYDATLPVRADTLRALPNMEFDAFPISMPNDPNFRISVRELYIWEIFGQWREIRSLLIGNLATTIIETADGIGETGRSYAADGGGTNYHLTGANIDGNVFGRLVRYETPQFAVSHQELKFGNTRDSIRIVLKNQGDGLTVVDSTSVNNSSDFYSFLAYDAGSGDTVPFPVIRNDSVPKQTFFIFPKDSMFVDLIVQPAAFNAALQDTLRFYARGIEGTVLPTLSIPVSYDPLVSVEDKTANNPSEFRLEQNYPNPFNARTNIRFNLSESGYTVMKILNLKGQEVMQVLDRYLAQGEHEVHFTGQHLSSGIYFYRLESGGKIQTKKFLLLN